MKPELKIIADHLRSSCFLIADGILPGNEGRGYVLRRIMRRAMRQIHKLGAKQATMYKLVDALIKEMGAAYPELARARDTIVETLKNEEEKFRETLEKGLKILEEEIEKNQSKNLSGVIAFKLHDTYGFPLDLTQDILKEKSLDVDLEEFNREMEIQRNRGKENWSGSGENKEDDLFFRLKEKHGETKFLGYETLEIKAKILAIEEITATKQKFIILNQTPFYATSGGQKGDDGKIILGQNQIEISETKKFAGNLFVHLISNIEGDFKIGDEVIAKVNAETRSCRANNHSATHLLHKALKELLGNSISQKGSNVDAESFTFDFNFNRAITPEELKKIEDKVNFYIQQNSAIKTEVMSLEKARESGAEALFGEKYDSEVRVLAMGKKEDNQDWSVELCGGTHAKKTGDIEIFKIISEKSVASGIRRIEAKTGSELKKYLAAQEEKLRNFALELRQKINQKDQEIINFGGTLLENKHNNENDPKILEEILKQKDKEIERLKKQILFSNLEKLSGEKLGEINLVSHVFQDSEAKDIRDIATEIKNKKDFQASCIFAFFGIKDEKISVCISLNQNLLEKFDATKLITPIVEALGGKGGGGKKDLAMGGGINKDNILQAIEILKSKILN